MAKKKRGGASKKSSGSARARLATAEGMVSPKQAPLAPPAEDATQFMAVLSRRFTAENLCTRLTALMEAETPPILDKAGVLHTRPDNGVRLRAVELALAYRLGRPVERQQIIHHEEQPSLEGIIKQAQASPVLVDTLIGLLTDIRRQSAESVDSPPTISDG